MNQGPGEFDLPTKFGVENLALPSLKRLTFNPKNGVCLLAVSFYFTKILRAVEE